MGRAVRMVLLSLAMISLPACAAPKKQSIGHFYFDYQILNGAKVGLLQAFDDGRQTFLQFRDLDLRRAPDVWTEDASGMLRPAKVEATMPYLVIGAVSRKVTLTFRHGEDYQEVYIVRTGDLPAPPPEPESAPAAPSAAGERSDAGRSLAQAHSRKSGTARSRRDSPQVPSALAATTVPARAEGTHAQSAACDLGSLSGAGKTINVPFYADSAEPSSRAREELPLVAAKLGGGDVIVRGRPSSGADLPLAQRRAQAIKATLVLAGVAPSRLTVEIAGPKPGPVKDVFFSEIVYSVPSIGFVVLDGCDPLPNAAN